MDVKLNSHITLPEIRPVDILQANQEALNKAYDDFFFHYSMSPVFIVNTNNINFVESPEHLSDLISKIIEPRSGITFYHPGGM